MMVLKLTMKCTVEDLHVPAASVGIGPRARGRPALAGVVMAGCHEGQRGRSR